MKLCLFIVLGCTLLATTACVMEPYGGGGHGYYYGGGQSQYYRGAQSPYYGEDQHYYGRRVWQY